MEWSNCRAIVSGGASGLGLAVVNRIHQGGGQVAIVDSNIVMAEQRAFEFGDGVIASEVDVSDEKSVYQALQEAKEYLGRINLLVNCAGILHSEKMVGSSRSINMSHFQRVISVNLTGTYLMCRAAAESMRDNLAGTDDERGLIINTASIAAYEGQVGQTAYSASKGAVASMTLPMARELEQFNIRVMCIAPGVFDTTMMGGVPEEVRTSIAAQSLYPHRMGLPEEFASLVQAIYENPMLNASVIRLDGGLRMPAR